MNPMIANRRAIQRQQLHLRMKKKEAKEKKEKHSFKRFTEPRLTIRHKR
jgi:hypothetical protein